MKTRPISLSHQARESARIEREIRKCEDAMALLKAKIRGFRSRLRLVKRGLVPTEGL